MNEFVTRKQEKQNTYQYMSANSFRCTAPAFTRRRFFRPLYVRGHLKISKLELKTKRHFINACQTISNRAWNFDKLGQSMTRRVLAWTFSGAGHFEDT